MDYRRFPPVRLPVPTLVDVANGLGLSFDFHFLGHAYDPEAELRRLEEKVNDVDVFFLYDSSVDHYGHHRGASAHILSAEIDRLAGFIRSVTQSIEQRGEAEVLLFSDHGMTNISAGFDLLASLKDVSVGTDYLVFIDSTFARFWYLHPTARERIHEHLISAPASFLSEDEKRKYGIDFADTRYGEDILVADEGVVFHPSYISPPLIRTKSYPDVATHGYRPEASTASGICFYRGTALSERFPDPVPATDVFVYASAIMRAISAGR
jgi:predicted AlkP superfamily pyrophosphatase or phosphodiesterase